MVHHQPGHRIGRALIERLRNLVPAALWAGFALGALSAFARHGAPMSLAMALVNAFIAWLFLTRRPEAQASPPLSSASLLAWIGTFLPFLLRPNAVPAPEALLPLVLTLQFVGVLGIVLALGALGRSFGLSPAIRDVVTHGLYARLRHPLYAAELLYFLGVVLGSLTLSNVLVWAALLVVQWRRALNEERCLAADPAYRDYLGRVRYRFWPGIL